MLIFKFVASTILLRMIGLEWIHAGIIGGLIAIIDELLQSPSITIVQKVQK